MDIKTQVKETAHQVEKFGQENVVVKTAHKGIQASLGAVALGVEEVEAVIKRLVEKGEWPRRMAARCSMAGCRVAASR